MNYNKLHHIIAQRENIDDEDDEALETWRTQLATFLTEDVNGTVEWLKTDCTREQFEWLSELFDKYSPDPKIRDWSRLWSRPATG